MRNMTTSAICAAVLMLLPLSEAEKGVLRISIRGIKIAEGSIRIAACASEEEYTGRKEPSFRIIIPAQKDTVNGVLRNLKPGNYAVKAFHDRNDNGKLDKGFFGKPKELYGFSRNPEPGRGIPEWKQTLIRFSGNSTNITVNLAR